MGEIKSALEIALEKAERLGKVSKEELEEQKWEDEGKKRAASFLMKKVESMEEAMKDIPGQYIQIALKGACQILVRNIVLPREKEQWETIKRAFKGLSEIKGSIADQVIPQIEYLLKNYEQTISSYKSQFQQQVQASLGGQQGALTQEALGALASMQEEWGKISSEIRKKFEEQLEPLKSYLCQ